MMSVNVLLTFISVITMIVIASPSIFQYHSINMIMMILNVCHLFGHIDVLTLYQYYYGCDFFWRISTTLQWPCGQNAGDIWRFLKMGETPKTIGFNTKMDWFWMICGGPIWGNPPYDDILWYMVVSKNDGSKSVHLPWANMRKPMLLGYAVAKLPSLAGWSHAPRQLQFFVIVQVCYDAEWRNSLPAKCVHIYRYTVCLYVYIYILWSRDQNCWRPL